MFTKNAWAEQQDELPEPLLSYSDGVVLANMTELSISELKSSHNIFNSNSTYETLLQKSDGSLEKYLTYSQPVPQNSKSIDDMVLLFIFMEPLQITQVES